MNDKLECPSRDASTSNTAYQLISKIYIRLLSSTDQQNQIQLLKDELTLHSILDIFCSIHEQTNSKHNWINYSNILSKLPDLLPHDSYFKPLPFFTKLSLEIINFISFDFVHDQDPTLLAILFNKVMERGYSGINH
jgi:hypothetical protein